MSFHLPGPTKGKIEHLIATYGAERISKPPEALHDIPESKALICVVIASGTKPRLIVSRPLR